MTTPFIANWPAVIKPKSEYIDQPCHVTDLIPTLMDVAGITYPTDFGGMKHPPLPGRSFAPILKTGEQLPPRTMHFALFNNLAVVHNGWKIVTAYSQPWQLYDLTNDRTETRNLALERPDKLAELLAIQKAFNAQSDVRLRLNSGEREPEYALPYREDGRIGPGSRESVEDDAYSLLLVKALAEGRQPSEIEMVELKKQAAKENAPAKKARKEKEL